jgi:molybdopterin converting factor small subunit
MKVRITAYGIVRDIAGRTFELEVEGTSVGDLRNALLQRYPALSGLASLLVAVNEGYAADDVAIQPEDEVVLIPPVSGG